MKVIFDSEADLLAGTVDSSSPVVGMYTDRRPDGVVDDEAEKHLEWLKGAISTALPKDRQSEFEVSFDDGINPDNAEHRDLYLKPLMDEMCKVVLDALNRAAQKPKRMADTCVDESSLHLSAAMARNKIFTPTPSSSSALEKVNRYLQGPGGQALVVWGPSGSGKTYVMSRAAMETGREGATVVRFLGTSGRSADVASLLRSVCEQLRAISNGREAYIAETVEGGLGPVPPSFNELKSHFIDALVTWKYGPLWHFIDSVDQLDDSNGGRRLEWLPLTGLASSVHLVVSTLPDDKDADGRAFRCLAILRKVVPVEHQVQVELVQNTRELLKHHLLLAGRCVTDVQMDALVDTFSRANNEAKTPLMAKLLAEKAIRWRSKSRVPNMPLSMRGIIVEYFDGFAVELGGELEMSQRLVERIIGLLTAARRGLTAAELQEVLSIDDDVLSDTFPWWFTPEKRMPWAPVLLLLAQLEPYQTRLGQADGGELVNWYHRQFWEAGENYLAPPKVFAEVHCLLAEFFIGRWAETEKPCIGGLKLRVAKDECARFVRAQPYLLKGTSVFHPDAVYNQRRCGEALYHMVKELAQTEMLNESSLKCWQMCESEVCSVEGAVARIKVGEVFNMVSQCAKVMQASTADSDHTLVYHFLRWLLRYAHYFSSNDTIAVSLLRQPWVSKLPDMYYEYQEHTQQIPNLPVVVLGRQVEFDAITSVLRGHEGSVNCVDWRGDRLVSGDSNGTIIISDVHTGERIMQWKGHAGAVNSVAWSADGSKLASGSGDKTVIIWNPASGEQVSQLKGHTNSVQSVSWNADGSNEGVETGTCSNCVRCFSCALL